MADVAGQVVGWTLWLAFAFVFIAHLLLGHMLGTGACTAGTHWGCRGPIPGNMPGKYGKQGTHGGMMGNGDGGVLDEGGFFLLRKSPKSV